MCVDSPKLPFSGPMNSSKRKAFRNELVLVCQSSLRMKCVNCSARVFLKILAANAGRRAFACRARVFQVVSALLVSLHGELLCGPRKKGLLPCGWSPFPGLCRCFLWERIGRQREYGLLSIRAVRVWVAAATALPETHPHCRNASVVARTAIKDLRWSRPVWTTGFP